MYFKRIWGTFAIIISTVVSIGSGQGEAYRESYPATGVVFHDCNGNGGFDSEFDRYVSVGGIPFSVIFDSTFARIRGRGPEPLGSIMSSSSDLHPAPVPQPAYPTTGTNRRLEALDYLANE